MVLGISSSHSSSISSESNLLMVDLVLGLEHGQQAVFNIVGKGSSGCDGLLLGFGEVLEDSAKLSKSLL